MMSFSRSWFNECNGETVFVYLSMYDSKREHISKIIIFISHVNSLEGILLFCV